MGEAGREELLKTTIETAVAMGAVRKNDLHRVIVDTTVQEKAKNTANLVTLFALSKDGVHNARGGGH